MHWSVWPPYFPHSALVCLAPIISPQCTHLEDGVWQKGPISQVHAAPESEAAVVVGAGVLTAQPLPRLLTRGYGRPPKESENKGLGLVKYFNKYLNLLTPGLQNPFT